MNLQKELTYRFLLIKGDSLGGSMRNYVGELAQMKLVRKLLSLLAIREIPYYVLSKQQRKQRMDKRQLRSRLYSSI